MDKKQNHESECRWAAKALLIVFAILTCSCGRPLPDLWPNEKPPRSDPRRFQNSSNSALHKGIFCVNSKSPENNSAQETKGSHYSQHIEFQRQTHGVASELFATIRCYLKRNGLAKRKRRCTAAFVEGYDFKREFYQELRLKAQSHG
jgi:hypothetical protein